MTPEGKTALALLASAGLLLGTAACSSSGGSAAPSGPSGGATLSYSALKSTVRGLASNPPCPFGLDPGAALEASGNGRAVTPAAGTEPPVRAEVVPPEEARPLPSGGTAVPSAGTVPARPEHLQVWCSYTAGTAPLEIGVIVAPAERIAVSLALPYIQRAGKLSPDQLVTASNDQPAPGEARTTPGAASVGIARVPVTDQGDLALIVSQGADAASPDPALTGEPLRRLAETLAGQLHL